jgi:hypothetical protein
MIKILTQPVSSGRKHYRSPEFLWSNVSGTSYGEITINHGLNTYAVEIELYIKSTTGSYMPHDYRFDRNDIGQTSSTGWFIRAGDRNSIILRMYNSSGNAPTIMDVYAIEEDFPTP